MEFTSIYLMLSTLSITPDRFQFFQYEQISLECVANSSGWTVKRTTASKPAEACKHGWAIPGESSCTIEDALPSDTGTYWCESEQGYRSKTVNISVTAGVVILESPSHPVTEGDNVTLRCSYREDEPHKPTSNFVAAFYQDNVYIGTESTGRLTLVASKSNEGFYKCIHPLKGESPQSWLTVKVRDQSAVVSTTPLPPPSTFTPSIRLILCALLFVMYNVIFIVCICIYRKVARANAEAKRRTSDG